jgi:hypothetical protein
VRQLYDIFQSDVAFATLHPTHIIPMQPARSASPSWE